ncbi:unnamed protein product [Phytophthora fragariaefolia]|uniref:Unnamed protein product n=1 Tax=Phytophthora fragariaefolia TaxID=1490495 RepID=A0A9W6Y6P6_9STRA|nr:unnamed protein product [Phytophthora fragariaefolia]
MQEAKLEGALDIRHFNVDQPVPVITAIPIREKIREAIEIIDQIDNPELLARWRDYGCAAYGQVKLIDYVVEHNRAVEGLNLGQWFVGKHPQNGVELLDFRSNLWLHSSSTIAGFLVLRETYEAVGVINPRFHEIYDIEQKLRTAKGYGADEASLELVIIVINVGNHWAAFFVDIPAKVCYLFDPLQLASNLSTLKEEVLNVVEKIVGLTDQLHYEVITDCNRGTVTRVDCGVW